MCGIGSTRGFRTDQMSTQRILCGLCKSDLTGPADHDDDSIFRCPVCGQEEKSGDIVKEAHAFMTDVVTRRLDAQLDEITKIHGKTFEVTADKFNPAPRVYRFILDDVP